MTNPPEHSTSIPYNSLRKAAFAIATVVALGLIATQSAQAQTYIVLHSFTGGSDGAFPYAGLTMDQTGTFYGTTCQGGKGYGVVYSVAISGTGAVFNVLYSFHGVDGYCPVNKVIFGPDGALYGTTRFGGQPNAFSGWGVVFKLSPSCDAPGCDWSETVLYRFQGKADGSNPEGDLIFDQAGNIYGTVTEGGTSGDGAVFQLQPSNGGWTKSLLYSFTGGRDGSFPGSGVILDPAGNLYGTTNGGGPIQEGIVFELSPNGSGWTETVLHGFTGSTNDGAQPAGLVSDPVGNLYGATSAGGSKNAGVSYELTPSNGSWIYQTLHSFTFFKAPSAGPEDALFRDDIGNLYGSQVYNPSGGGSIFKLAAGTWTETDLHAFEPCSEGCEPTGSVILDEQGNLYGTTLTGDSNGVVWEITP